MNFRSLLEKLAADIEMMDKEEGLSPEEFDRFLARVPKHLKAKFNAIAVDFKKFDTNNDNLIDYNELSKMLDMVMES